MKDSPNFVAQTVDHFGTMSSKLILVCIGAAAITYIAIRAYNVAIRKREMLRYGMKLYFATLFLFAGGMYGLSQLGLETPTVFLGAILLSLCGRLFVRRPSDSRYIPEHVKRAVIRRDLGGEVDYDPSVHHFDHIVPWSRGGDTSVDNLRLVSKAANLRKGAKKPRMRDFY